MKKTFYTIAAFVSFNCAYAQEEMTPVWEKKLEHKMDLDKGVSEKQGLCYGASEKEITILENGTGNIKWSMPFKTVSDKLRKVDDLIPMWDAKTIFLFDRKMGKDQIACVDLQSGKLLWNTDKYQDVTDENVVYIPELEAFAISLKASLVMIKARTGEEIWQTSKFKGVVGAYVYTSDGNLVMVNYKPTALGALFSGFKNQIVKINTKNGDVLWDQTYIGMVERKAVTREAVAKIKLMSDKIFLIMNGLQVYDYATGTKAWSAAYDISLDDLVRAPGGTKRWGVYDAVAEPLVVGNDVYIIDMQSKKSQYVKKYELNSGKLIWTSPELKAIRVAPNLYLVGDKVILQIGGAVETQAYIRKVIRNGDGSSSISEEWRVDNPNVKPWGLECFDGSTGKLVWRSERFSKGITNAFVGDGNVYVCSGKAIYAMNIADGKEKYEIQLGDDNIGLATKIIDHKDRVVIIGSKGMSSHKKADGVLVASGKYKTCTYRAKSENIVLLQTESADLAAFDMETCKFKKFDARKESIAELSEDGKYVYVFEKRTISKLATK